LERCRLRFHLRDTWTRQDQSQRVYTSGHPQYRCGLVRKQPRSERGSGATETPTDNGSNNTNDVLGNRSESSRCLLGQDSEMRRSTNQNAHLFGPACKFPCLSASNNTSSLLAAVEHIHSRSEDSHETCESGMNFCRVSNCLYCWTRSGKEICKLDRTSGHSWLVDRRNFRILAQHDNGMILIDYLNIIRGCTSVICWRLCRP